MFHPRLNDTAFRMLNASTIVLLAAGVGLVFAVLFYVKHRHERRRVEGLRQVAGSLGFSFEPAGDAALQESLGAFYLLSQGVWRKLTNLLRRTSADCDVAVFDYQYSVTSGKDTHTYGQTVVGLRFTGPPLPHFSLSPENVFHKIGAWFGYQDIDFESHPEFSRRFLLRGHDEAAVRNLFTPVVREFFEQHAGLGVEGIGNTLICYRDAERIAPDKIRDFVNDAVQTLGQLQTSLDNM